MPHPKTPAIRPIAIGDTIFKLASAYACHKSKRNLPQVFGDIQLGVGIAGGSELATHILQATADAYDTLGIEFVVGHFDITNAFNTIERAKTMDAVYKEHRVSDTWGCLHLAYSSPSPLLILEKGLVVGKIMSEQGVRQGDPLSSMAFALGIQAAYEAAAPPLPRADAFAPSDRRETKERHPSPTLVAIMDDLKVIGTPTAVFDVVDRFARALPGLGLSLNTKKTQVQWPHPVRSGKSVPQHVSDIAEARGIQVVQGNVVCFGASVGFDDEQAHDMAQTLVTDSEELFASLEPTPSSSHDVPNLRIRSQAAFHILRICARPKMNYAARSMPPETLADAAESFDQRALACLTSIAGLDDLSGDALDTATRSIDKGGLGMRTQASVLHAAYFSAASNAAPHIRSKLSHLFGGVDPYTLGNRAPRFVRRLENCRQLLQSQGVPTTDAHSSLDPPSYKSQEWHTLPASVTDVITHYQSAFEDRAFKLQRRITHELELSRMRLSADTSPKDKARNLSASTSQAGLWLTSLPTETEFSLTDLEFSKACRLRLGQPMFNLAGNIPHSCVCGTPLDQEVINDHFFACKLISKHSKHNHLVKTVALRIERATPFLVTIEPPLTTNKNPRRGDFKIVTGLDGSFTADVTQVHPLCKSYIKEAQQPLGAAKVREAYKIRNQPPTSVLSPHDAFIPFVTETYGAIGAAATNFISQVANAGTMDARQATGFKEDIYRAIAFSIQKGNASIARAWAIMMSHHGLASFNDGDLEQRSQARRRDARLIDTRRTGAVRIDEGTTQRSDNVAQHSDSVARLERDVAQHEGDSVFLGGASAENRRMAHGDGGELNGGGGIDDIYVNVRCDIKGETGDQHADMLVDQMVGNGVSNNERTGEEGRESSETKRTYVDVEGEKESGDRVVDVAELMEIQTQELRTDEDEQMRSETKRRGEVKRGEGKTRRAERERERVKELAREREKENGKAAIIGNDAGGDVRVNRKRRRGGGGDGGGSGGEGERVARRGRRSGGKRTASRTGYNNTDDGRIAKKMKVASE